MDSGIASGTYRYYVSLDFGTHGSGFAYSAKIDGDSSPRTYENWSGQRGIPAAKTRTALLYCTDDLSKPRAWGWDAVAEHADLPELSRDRYLLVESFKKYLMPDDFKGLPPLPPGLSISKLVTDFLTCLVTEVVTPTLKDHYGPRFHLSAVRWCLTVPAGLSQASMSVMKASAMKAGLIPSADSPALLLTSEPEAAALTAKHHRDLLGLQTGTVDMTIHKIVIRLSPQIDTTLGGDAVSLSELTHRECLAEGATRVDERFLQHLAENFGRSTIDSWRKDPTNAADVQELIYDEWETCKCSFSGDSLATTVNLPYSLFSAAGPTSSAAVDSDRLVLSPSTMESFFWPSLSAIIDRAQAMLGRAGGADVVVLVGGFSGSRFVRRELSAALEAGGMPVVAPDYGATPVLEGAVWLSRYPAAVAARRSCMTYGVRAIKRWEPGAPSKRFVPHYRTSICPEGFTTCVKRDELIKAGSVVSKEFSPLIPYSRRVTAEVYGCLHKDAKYITEDSMTKIATVVIDTPLCGANPDDNQITVHFSFGDTQISVRCVDEATGKEQQAKLIFDSSEVLKGADMWAT